MIVVPTGDALDGAMGDGGVATSITVAVESLKSSISSFMHDIHWLMRILDDVAKIHPFVAGMYTSDRYVKILADAWVAPILAFKAVYSMERTRQENDKRIISLYVAMKDMIAVLVEYVSRCLG